MPRHGALENGIGFLILFFSFCLTRGEVVRGSGIGTNGGLWVSDEALHPHPDNGARPGLWLFIQQPSAKW